MRLLLGLLCVVSAWVRPQKAPRQARAVRAAASANSVFVRNIAWRADAQLLREALERHFGMVSHVYLPRRPDDPTAHRGFAFVTFASPEAAEVALSQQERPPMLLGRPLRCAPNKDPVSNGTATEGRGRMFANLQQAVEAAEVATALEGLGLEGLRDAKEFNMAIAAWARARRPARAVALLQQMRAAGVQPAILSFNLAISACGKGALWEEALALLKEMGSCGLEPDVISYNSAISACEKVGRWQEALALLDEMHARGPEPDVISFSAAISACEKAGRWEHALALLDEMPRRSIEPNAFSFNAAISACEKGSQWERALSLLEDMQSRGLKPDVISYNAAMSACKRSAQWERALSLLDEMQARGLEPDVISFNAAILACEEAAQGARARGLLDEMRGRGLEPDVISFNGAIAACEKAGLRDHATQLYAAAIDRGLYARVAERIDLHDHPATVAVAAVAFAMGEFARKRAPIPSAGFTIVTGRGANSVDNIAVIRPRVVTMLAEEYADLGAVHDKNPGQLFIEAADLAAWASAQSSQ